MYLLDLVAISDYSMRGYGLLKTEKRKYVMWEKNGRFCNVKVGSTRRNCRVLKGYTPNAVDIIVFASAGDRSSK